MVAAGNGHKFWRQVCSPKTAPVAAWLQPAEESVLQIGSKENPRKGPKNSLYVWLIFKREFTCVVWVANPSPSWGVFETVFLFLSISYAFTFSIIAFIGIHISCFNLEHYKRSSWIFFLSELDDGWWTSARLKHPRGGEPLALTDRV